MVTETALFDIDTMPSIPIWKRSFVRSAALDRDEIADEQFREANFTDAFGQFLQQGENANKKTFDDLVSTFYKGFCLCSLPISLVLYLPCSRVIPFPG